MPTDAASTPPMADKAALERLRSELRGFFASPHAAGPLSGAALDRHLGSVGEALAGPLPPNPETRPLQVEGARFWRELSAAPATVLEGVVGAARGCDNVFAWEVNDNYRGQPGFDEGFFRNEAYVQLIGPEGLMLSDTIRLGFLVMGGDVHYPWHSHEAAELYHTVSGTGEWGQGDGTFRPKAPGEAIFHESFETHAMRTSEPILAMWTWSGAIGLDFQVD